MRSYVRMVLSCLLTGFCASMALSADSAASKPDDAAIKAKIAAIQAKPILLKTEKIGKVEKFSGVARILSGDKIAAVTAVGQDVFSGDKIQTEEGEVEIKFNDGALLTVAKFSVFSTDEKKETKGIFFKSTEDARRMTCFVGKGAFKSAGEKGSKKNYLQTPTAVCALRGTEVVIGFSVQTFLNIISGNVRTDGSVIQNQPVPDSNREQAVKSAVYNAIATVASAPGGGAAPNVQRAALLANKAAAQAMMSSTDPAVRNAAAMALAVVNAQIAVVEARIAVVEAQAAVVAGVPGADAALTAAANALTTVTTAIEAVITAATSPNASVADVIQAAAAVTPESETIAVTTTAGEQTTINQITEAIPYENQ